ncbi:MAG TPA: GAF domain-containing protein, partial [Gammaproteobacteria bacterium]|nr:GAF domain-containing protein [Gammaproteobacteria bacterium]
MLTTLRRIVQEATQAEGLSNVLELIVHRVHDALEVDVASIYLLRPHSRQLAPMATEGLPRNALGRVRLQQYEGLVELVAERAEPVNLNHVAEHSRYRHFPGTGNQQLNSFLGVPILHRRELLGVLVVQGKQESQFSED